MQCWHTLGSGSQYYKQLQQVFCGILFLGVISKMYELSCQLRRPSFKHGTKLVQLQRGTYWLERLNMHAVHSWYFQRFKRLSSLHRMQCWHALRGGSQYCKQLQ